MDDITVQNRIDNVRDELRFLTTRLNGLSCTMTDQRTFHAMFTMPIRDAEEELLRIRGLIECKQRARPGMKDTKAENPVAWVCANCGSDAVSVEAQVTWDIDLQEFTVAETCDKGHMCPDCDHEVRLKEVAHPAPFVRIAPGGTVMGHFDNQDDALDAASEKGEAMCTRTDRGLVCLWAPSKEVGGGFDWVEVGHVVPEGECK